MEEETGLELRNNYYDEDEEEQNVLGEINKITNLSKAQLLKKLGDKTLDEIKGDMDKLELMEKEIKKNNIKNNLEAIKIKKKIVEDCKQVELTTFKELSNKNIILSFNYGFKNYVAKKKGGGFVFNKSPCELKSTLKFDNFKSIIFYLNVFVSGKLNLNIISPYILD
jgi:hypothetical protein